MLIIELLAILFTLATACIGTIIREIERGIIAQFGNQMSTQLSDHLQRIIMAKSAIKDQVPDLAVRTDHPQ